MPLKSRPVDHEELLAHAGWVRVLALRLVRDDDRADDVAQQSLLAALESPPREGVPLGAWLVGIVRNTASKSRRAAARVHLLDPDSASRLAAPRPDENAARAEMFRDLADAVLALEPIYRDVVVLRFFDALEMNEVALRLAVPVETARTRLKRALAMLRERLDRRYGNRTGWALVAAGMGERSPAPIGPCHATRRIPTAPAVTTVAGGGLLMGTKTVVSAAIVVLVVAIFASLRFIGSAPVIPEDARGSAMTQSPQTLAGRARRLPREPDVATETDPSQPAERDGASFIGRVVDGDGNAIAGATVTVTASRPNVELGTSPAQFSKSVADSDGKFLLTLPKGTLTADVAATAPGFAVTWVERVRPAIPVEIRLAREGVLTGRVLEPAGKPIEGATVRVFRILGQEHVDADVSTTGADGTYRIGRFARSQSREAQSERTILDVRAPAFGALEDWGPFPEAGEQLRRDIVLVPTRPLAVLVLNADTGAPVPDCEVSLHSVRADPRGVVITTASGSQYALPHPAPAYAKGTTDLKGMCTLVEAPSCIGPSDVLSLRATKPGFVTAWTQVGSRQRAEDERLELRVWPAVTVTGRVVDAAGTPVVGASVHVLPPAGGSDYPGFVPTDERGLYRIPSVRATAAGAAVVKLLAFGPFAPTADGRLFAPGGVTVEIHPRTGVDMTAPEFVLEEAKPSATAIFVVVDRDGRPVVDALLRLGNGGWWRDVRAWNPRTDDSGRAVLRWHANPANPEAWVEVWAPGLARTLVRCRPDVAVPPEVRVVLAPATRLVGRASEVDGRPVRGAFIRAAREGSEAASCIEGLSANDGSFSLSDLPCDPFKVTAEVVGRDGSALRSATVEGIVPGRDPVEIVLPADPTKYGTLVATLVAEEDGSPLMEATVRVESDPPAVPSPARPQAGGTLTLPNVPVGTWSAEGSAHGRLTTWGTITIAEGQTTQVRLALARATSVTVRLVAPPDADAAGAVNGVSAALVDVAPGQNGAGSDFYARLDRDQVARFEALRPGRYRLRCQTPGVGGARGRVYVAAVPLDIGPPSPTSAALSLRLVEGGLLSVKIADEDAPERPKSWGVRPKGALEVVSADGERHRVVQGAPRGAAPQFELLPGAYTVRLHLPSGRVREALATVRVGEVTQIVFGAR